VIDKIREDMDKTELVPFRNAAKEGIEMVMTAHISLPNLAGSKLPATLSPEALGILRNDFKYEGVIMSDCLEMDGIRATYGTVEGALMTLQAGADNVMICHTYEVQTGGIDRVCAAIGSGEISQARIDQSLTRLEKLKQRLTSWDNALKTNPADALTAMNALGDKLAQGIYAKSSTLVRSKAGVLPLSTSSKTVFVTPGYNPPTSGVALSGDDARARALAARRPTMYGDVIRKHNPATTDIQFGESGLSAEQWKQLDDADVVILTTRNAKQSQYQQDLGLEVASRCGSKLVAIATCAPYDFLEEPKIETYAVIYEPTVEALTAMANVLYGVTSAQGKLPVAYKSAS
jgi:beta-N-acetylhexosaminidase